MYLIMLGAQGTGKGTVAGILAKETGWPQISTGDIFRANISNNTELGIKANEYISKGQLVPDDITVPMVINRLSEDDCRDGAILDGFPRTVEQAEKLDEILAEKSKKVDLVINLTTPRDEIITRILNRRVCSNPECKATYNITMHPSKVEGICDICGSKLVQRGDDSDENAIKQRLAIYDEKTSPLIDFYTKKGVLITEEISQRINRLGQDVADDVFATLDIAIVDLYKGNIEFIKNGACPTYIKNNRKIQIIKSLTLPAGIVKSASTDVFDKDIENNDIIVMCSDGILDSNIEYKNKELWVKYLLEDIEVTNPQKIADIILNESVDNNFGKIKDDMSVVVCKFIKKM